MTDITPIILMRNELNDKMFDLMHRVDMDTISNIDSVVWKERSDTLTKLSQAIEDALLHVSNEQLTTVMYWVSESGDIHLDQAPTHFMPEQVHDYLGDKYGVEYTDHCGDWSYDHITTNLTPTMDEPTNG